MMKRHVTGVLAVVVILALTCVYSAAQEKSMTTVDPKAFEQLAWLEGSWVGEGLGGAVEEHWTGASGGTLLGQFRLVAGGETKVIEYLLITREAERVVYRFKHFREDYTTWEKDGPLEFTLIEVSDTVAVFHSEVSDQHSPRRLTYRLEGKNDLVVEVAGSDETGRITDAFEVRYSRR